MAPPSAFEPSLRQVSGLFLERGRRLRFPGALSPGFSRGGWGVSLRPLAAAPFPGLEDTPLPNTQEIWRCEGGPRA